MTSTSCSQELLFEAGRAFGLGESPLEVRPHGSGHINDTFAAVYDRPEGQTRYLLQRLNSRVFLNPRAVMENVALVCRHLGAKTRERYGNEGATRRALALLPSLTGEPWWIDADGEYWRSYPFIEGATGLDQVTSPEQAYEAARAFGNFATLLADLPPHLLQETIPHFHHTGKRFQALQNEARTDSHGRAAKAARDLDFAFAREPLAYSLLALEASGDVPRRAIHNDTKLNNVMLDDRTGEGICVVDLDTVMPGLSLYDFGDMVRSATSPAPEDERDLAKVYARPEVFEALVSGFLSSAGTILNEVERDHLLTAGKVITYEIGLRFLTDYLAGDTYFKTTYTDHNLDRCRTQFQLLRSLEEQEDALQRIVTTTKKTLSSPR